MLPLKAWLPNGERTKPHDYVWVLRSPASAELPANSRHPLPATWVCHSGCLAQSKLQMTTAPADTSLQPHERTQGRTDQLSPADAQNFEGLIIVSPDTRFCGAAKDNCNSI